MSFALAASVLGMLLVVAGAMNRMWFQIFCGALLIAASFAL